MNSITILVLIAIAFGANAQYNRPTFSRPTLEVGSIMKQNYAEVPRIMQPTPASNYGANIVEIPRGPVPTPASNYGANMVEIPKGPEPTPASYYGSVEPPRAEAPAPNPCTEEVMRSSEISLFANPSDSASYLICTDVDVFISMPCSPGTVFDQMMRHCIPIGWEAPRCPPNTCQNQADCYIDENFQHKCNCRVGFTGQFCEINIDECALEGNRVCSSYNGQCIDQINGFYCQWGNEIGLIWEKRISNPCTLENLAEERQFFELISDNGNVFLQCTGELTFLVSKCADMLFWHQELRTCSIERPLPKTGVCNNYPCKNDGECLDLGGSNFQCLCQTGYTGALCEQTIDFCLNNPCSNNGRCVSHPRGYNCVCQDKVVDDSCATGVTNPCPAGSRDYFPNPLNANRYFVCSVNGFAFSRSCAPGLIWSQDLLTCKLPVEIKAPQHQKPKLSLPIQSSYGQVLPTRPPMTPTPVQSYGQITPPRTSVVEHKVESYGQVLPPRTPVVEHKVESYGQVLPPRPPMTPTPVESYGQVLPPRTAVVEHKVESYGQVLPPKPPMTPTPVESYGQVLPPRPPMTPTPVQSYGQITPPRPPMTPTPVESYGQVLPPRAPVVEHKVESYGQITPPRLNKPAYGQRMLKL